MEHTSEYIAHAESSRGAASHSALAVSRNLARAVREHPIVAGLGALSAASTAFAAIRARGAAQRMSWLGVLSLGALAWRAVRSLRLRRDDHLARLGPVFPAPVYTPPRP